MTDRIGLRLRAKRLRTSVRRMTARALGINTTIYVDQRYEEYQTYWREAARLIGASFEPLSESVSEVRSNGSRARVSGHVVSLDDPVTLRIAGDKALCHRIAMGASVPVPDHLVFDLTTIERAEQRVREHPGPWVIKPAFGSASGLGITTGITHMTEVEQAAVLASLFSRRFLLERMLAGESCRLLYLDGELISAVRRRGLRLQGDGHATVRELMLQHRHARLIDDAVCALTLRAQDLRLDSVIPAGASVLLTGNPVSGHPRSELRTVYDEPITDLVGRETSESLARVVRALGTRFAGVDIVTIDPAQPLEKVGGAFIELNTTPGIHHHYQTQDDHRTHPVAVAVLRSMLGMRPVRR